MKNILKIICYYKPLEIFFVSGMRACRGSIVMAPLILNLGTIWRQVINFMPPATLHMGKNPGTH
jgi:hypothetical protein